MPDPQHTGDADDPRLNALIAWRQRLIDSGTVSKAGFKETHLRLILRSGRTDVEQIRAMLPGSVAEHAEELAAVLAEVDSELSPGRRHRSAPLSAVEPDGEPTATVDQSPLSTSDFATYTFAEQSGPLAAVTVRPSRDDDGGCELTWTPYLPGGDAVVIYRLVAQEDNAPYSPDRARLVAATTATTAADHTPTTSAVRYYQVWANAGATRTEALAAQPIKHAEGVAVSPVRDCVVRQDNGKVIGSWTVPSAVSAVFVSRMLAEDAGREGPQHRILLDRDNRAGFVDSDPAPGRRYVYRIRAAVPVDGVLRLAAPVDAEVEIAAVLTPVTDLMVTSAPGAAEGFELTWKAPPAGEVVIYRSQTGPAAGAEATELPTAALEQVGLTPDLLLTQPITEQPGPDGRPRSMMSGVSWPTDWSRAYFTPVTMLAGRALLGKTFCSVRTGVIRDVELAEYCNKQVLTFDWPQGAAVVVVYLAPKGYDPRNGLTGTSYEITVEQYEKYGGLQLPNGKLPVSGCSLHLAPVAFSAGRRAIGTVRSIEYAGLLRLQYAVQLSRDPQGQPSHATIYLRSEYEVPGSPAFVLVNHPDRIPLSPTDGEALDAAPLDAQGGLAATPSKELRWSALTTTGTAEPWAVDLRGRRGWIRLFVNTPSAARLRTIALLDPPVHSLRLSVGAP
ncbi:putative ESX-1 scaffolding and assembly protein SaeA [Mycobacterium mantenii]|uniref:ESX-1 scaffolding and assembly protein SaeA n=1 Tax=Mycobacterium mantenii TaxID=560555 RepID=A0A1X0FC51_MYCNT|nr:hypothetical protein [Mycobacterium mantenii]MCV7245312.1 hypothetical protein [Mycobacterium mantenii]ORA98779.1 hypothetical protein BST30_25325 [Mycobacterium mantenii]BBY37705.1 putative ESX-1 scaffolding and assembly protein SaeA [Mycobacterium mantenii]